jgi:hypothetical protein
MAARHSDAVAGLMHRMVEAKYEYNLLSIVVQY